MPPSTDVRVVPSQLRSEIRVRGVTRPMIDWFCTRKRALEHAMDEARALGEQFVLVENRAWDEGSLVAVTPPILATPLAA